MFEVDTTTWPLVVIRGPSGPVSDAMLDDFLAQLEGLHARAAPYGAVTDARPMTRPLAAPRWLRLIRWIDAHQADVQQYQRVNGVVLANAASRGLFRATVGPRHFKRPIRAIKTFEGAVDYVLAVLLEEGVLDEQRAAWCRAGARQAGPVRGEVPAEAVSDALNEVALLEMFTEPAYLVEPGVGVRHSNLAGRRAGVPEWLSGGQIPTEAPVPFRLMRLGGEASGLLLVVLDGSDRPRSAAWDLPPALDRVAQLLVDGRSDKEIARYSGLTLATVRTYVSRIFKRTGVHSRAEFAARFAPR